MANSYWNCTFSTHTHIFWLPQWSSDSANSRTEILYTKMWLNWYGWHFSFVGRLNMLSECRWTLSSTSSILCKLKHGAHITHNGRKPKIQPFAYTFQFNLWQWLRHLHIERFDMKEKGSVESRKGRQGKKWLKKQWRRMDMCFYVILRRMNPLMGHHMNGGFHLMLCYVSLSHYIRIHTSFNTTNIENETESFFFGNVFLFFYLYFFFSFFFALLMIHDGF